MLQSVYMKKLIMVRCASVVYNTLHRTGCCAAGTGYLFSFCKAAILNSVDTDASLQTLLRLNYKSN